ncbi:MAG: YqjF family protein [Mycobacterium sp.]
MTSLAGYPVTAPPLRRPVLIAQHWADLTFIHWPVRPETIAHLYPPGTRPDVCTDGLTYAGLVAFIIRQTALGTALPLPYFGTFAETNVRLYSIDDAGRHGVVFRSLDTARLAVVPLTRIALGVPYTWAKMGVTRSGDRISYHSVRRWPRPGLRSRLAVVVGDVLKPTPLEIWLTARWGAHTRKAGRTWWVPNEHAEWPLHAAEVVELDDDLLAAAGVRPVGGPLRAVFSPGVYARFGRPSLAS